MLPSFELNKENLLTLSGSVVHLAYFIVLVGSQVFVTLGRELPYKKNRGAEVKKWLWYLLGCSASNDPQREHLRDLSGH